MGLQNTKAYVSILFTLAMMGLPAGQAAAAEATTEPAPQVRALREASGGSPTAGRTAEALQPARGRVSARASGDKALAAMADHDLTADARRAASWRDEGAGPVGTADGARSPSPELQQRVRELTDPRFLRGGAAADGGARLPSPARPAAKDLPWSPDQLLANPTNMDDEYVSLAESPLSGHLYAVFAATDLGATDRDIHIARSTDGGATWDVWEMPSFTGDEYHPSLAIDGAGYIHVCWIRDDGYILRSRTTGPDDPTQWAWVKGLSVGEPCGTPSIAVSGAGDFAKVFIAAGYLTVNWDYYAYEWTLIFMSSSNGGNTVAWDYFLPDGYPDYWPSVAMSGGTVHFVNAEVDAYTGETEILIATDVYDGGFSSPASFTGWTANNTGFPRVACEGSDVYVVYQLDYSDGLSTDGDIIYTYSWDGAASFYGPYGMVADEYDSVGPTIFVKDGAVGCLWLDAPAGADEFHLAARLGAGFGAIDGFGDVEMVTEAPRVEPVFHSVAGVLTDGHAHAAWIDRRDYPTQGHNVYTSRRELQPDLGGFIPADWDSSLVVNMFAGERRDGWIAAGDTAWTSFAFANRGLRDADGPFHVDLRLDGVSAARWVLPDGLPKGGYVTLEDWPLLAGAGDHEVSVVLDDADEMVEADETDNVIARVLPFISGDPELRLRPTRLVVNIVPELQRAEALALAADPPLRREVQLPVVSPRLSEAVQTAKTLTAGSGQRLRVMVVPAERLDPPALGLALQGAARTTRREAMLLAARTQTARSLEALQPVLDSLERSGAVGRTQQLWASGMLAIELDAAAVEILAADPGVGRLWLDDQRCRTFAAPTRVDATALTGTSAAAAGDKALAWHLDAIGAPDAWAAGHTGAGVIVGHLDTGAAYDHDDLADRMWDGGTEFPHHGWDAVDEDNDPYDGDTDWYHGTHTAGLIVGDGSAGTATGAAPGARLMALRAVPGYYEDVVEAMQFGLDHGAHLFNMSAGWTLPPDDVRAANRYNAELLNSIDVPWICAAGNGDGWGGHNPVPTDIASPGDCPNPWYAPAGNPTAVISVGGVTQALGISPTSSYGPTEWDVANTYGTTDYHDYPWPDGLQKPDLAAPGVNVLSLSGDYGYVAYDGTSMAAPLVTGACAVLLGATPGLTPAQLAEMLENAATDVTAAPAGAGRDNYTGAGQIDIPAALGQAPPPGSDELAFTITNYGPLPLDVDQVFVSQSWLSVPVPSAPVAPGTAARLRAAVDPARLVEGVHEAQAVFLSNDPHSPSVFPVILLYGDYPTDVGDDLPAAAGGALTNHPNPFNPRTDIRFATAREGRVTLALYDVKGRLVRTLASGRFPAGQHVVTWDGRDDRGADAPSGVYLARLRDADGVDASRKLTLVR